MAANPTPRVYENLLVDAATRWLFLLLLCCAQHNPTLSGSGEPARFGY